MPDYTLKLSDSLNIISDNWLLLASFQNFVYCVINMIGYLI